AVPATAAGKQAAYTAVTEIGADAEVTLELGDGGIVVVGGIDSEGGAWPDDAPVCAARLSEVEGDTFCTFVARGAFRMQLQPATYIVTAAAPGWVAGQRIVDRDADGVRLRAVAAAPAPDELVAWVKANAAAIAGADPGRPVADLEPFRATVGSARVVGLGEAVHGAHELLQMKHRLLAFLVDKLGFSVVALEADA